MPKIKQATLVFLLKEEAGRERQICLAMKKRGFGIGRWNGAGGKVEAGEELEETAQRETFEELGVEVRELRKVAELNFIFSYNPEWNQKVHVYFSLDWRGEPEESEEMRPAWFSVGDLPFKKMWADDIFWLPEVLAGKLVSGEFEFGKKDKLLAQKVFFVKSFK